MAGRVPLLVQISVEGHPWAPREQFFWFTFMPVIIPKAAMGTRQLDPERYKVCGSMLRVTFSGNSSSCGLLGATMGPGSPVQNSPSWWAPFWSCWWSWVLPVLIPSEWLVARTPTHREGVRAGSLSSQDDSWSPCKFAHSNHLCIPSFFRPEKVLLPFPPEHQVPAFCIFCSLYIYITNKGHEGIFPEQKAGTL